MANPFNFDNVRRLLNEFAFRRLFIEALGWSNPPNSTTVSFELDENTFTQTPIAELGGVMVYEIQHANGTIPNAQERKAVHSHIAKQQLEHLLIFVDDKRSKSFWYWVKREAGKSHQREHHYFKGQPADLFFGKLSGIVFSFDDFDDTGNVSVAKVTSRLRDALDVERTTKKFYKNFQEVHVDFLEYLTDISDEKDRRWYASVLLNRLMFIYFLQKKRFINADRPENYSLHYLRRKYDEITPDKNYYKDFLHPLFFEGFAKPEQARSEPAKSILGAIPYLNGGLFLAHKIELDYGERINIANEAFENILNLFDSFSWHLDDTPGGKSDEINPDVLGYIFEKYINQKELGAYYTRPEITEYLCEQTIDRLILDGVNTANPDLPNYRQFESVPELLSKLNGQLCKQLVKDVLPNMSLLDPACGSGVFLIAALKKLLNVYSAVVGWIRVQGQSDYEMKEWLDDIETNHPSVSYYLKKQIIINNLYGVDIVEEAVEITKVRLFLALVASAQDKKELEPLPNIDFNILVGNSLIGLMQVDPEKFDKKGPDGTTQQAIFNETYQQLVEKKNRLVDTYRSATEYSKDLQTVRDDIGNLRAEANDTLNQLLLDEFQALGIKYSQVTWDVAKNKEGKKKKRDLTKADMEALAPFHWGYEFSRIVQPPELGGRGGFDAIITNPPWDIFKPNSKEFFAQYSDTVSKRKMTNKAFKKEQARLLANDVTLKKKWEAYLREFPHVSEYYRGSSQYKNQISYVDGKKVGSDINLYKLFTELCYVLLKENGLCGLIIPSSIYNDLGAKQLRELLFTNTDVSAIYGLANERFLFEGVDHRVKFCLLSFRKGDSTEVFEAAFRINPREAISAETIEDFLHNKDEHVTISTALIHQLSPTSLSVMEFRNATDKSIAEKMLRFPMLGEDVEGAWNLKLGNEFHMTSDNALFNTQPKDGYLPLFEGKMIHQFTHQWALPTRWVDEKEGRRALLGKKEDQGQILNYQRYRLVYRAIARSTDSRTMICTILPKKVFYGNSLTSVQSHSNNLINLFLVAMMNSVLIDFSLRQIVSANLNQFYVYQLSIPRLNERHPAFLPIVSRAARLICTTPEFDELAAEVGLESHHNGVTDNAQRVKLRAELDAIVAHLYHLTEEELVHILATFPLMPDPEKVATKHAYRDIRLGLLPDVDMAMFQDPTQEDVELAALISKGESRWLEFKVAAAYNPYTKTKDGNMYRPVVEAVATFMNSPEGGTVIVGVDDKTGKVVGLADDFVAANSSKPNRDGYALWLSQKLDTLGKENSSYYDLFFHTVEGKEVCRIVVKPAAHPVYWDGHLHMRGSAGKKKLNAQETVAYLKQRWKQD